jgi:hypothetical protein
MALTKMARTNRATRAIAVSQPAPTVPTTALSTASAQPSSRAEQRLFLETLREVLYGADEDGEDE